MLNKLRLPVPPLPLCLSGKWLESFHSSLSWLVACQCCLPIWSAIHRSIAPTYGIPVIMHSDHCAKKLLPWFDGMLEADEAYYKQHKEPLFSSHMLDLSEESKEENIEICCKYFERMAKIDLWLEMEIGITGGEEDGVNNENVDNACLYTQPEDIVSSPLGFFVFLLIPESRGVLTATLSSIDNANDNRLVIKVGDPGCVQQDQPYVLNCGCFRTFRIRYQGQSGVFPHWQLPSISGKCARCLQTRKRNSTTGTVGQAPGILQATAEIRWRSPALPGLPRRVRFKQGRDCLGIEIRCCEGQLPLFYTEYDCSDWTWHFVRCRWTSTLVSYLVFVTDHIPNQTKRWSICTWQCIL